MSTELKATNQSDGRTYYPPIDPGGQKNNAEAVAVTEEETGENPESQQAAG